MYKFRLLMFVVPMLWTACDMTLSSAVEGVWVSHATELSILYEETYNLKKDGTYAYDRKQDGRVVYTESGTWLTEKQTVGTFEDEQRVIVFAPSSPANTEQYVRLYSMENNGKLLVLGTYVLESDSISKQRFYFKEVGK